MSLMAFVRRWGRVRLALAVVFLLLLGWLIHGAVFTESRYEAVTRALRDGRIGGLEPEASDELLNQIKWLARSAGVKEEVKLNQPPSPKYLSFYTTTPAAYGVTYCARRNAVYDAELDAVFIDMGLLNNGEFRSILEASGYDSVASLNNLPFFRVYLRFIVLHELGHRQLHRHGRKVFDLTRAFDGGGERKLEDEADQFAIRAMQAAYKADEESGGTFAFKDSSEFLGLGNYVIDSPSKRVWVDLISMASAMNMFDLFLQNPYAPFYQDRAHPTFLRRAQGLIGQSLRQPELDEKLRAHFVFFDKFLGREAEMLSQPLVEVVVPEPIESVNFDNRGLIVASRGLKALFTVPYAELVPPGEGAKSISVNPVPLNTGFDEDKTSMWSSSASGTFVFGSGGKTYVGSETHWEEVEMEITRAVAEQTSPDIFLPPQPSRTALAVSSTTGDTSQERWYALRDTHLTRIKTASEIAGEIAERGGPAGCRLTVNTITEQKVYLTIENCVAPAGTKALGVAVLDAATLGVLKVSLLRSPDLPDGIERRLVVAPVSEVEKYILVSGDGESRPSGWAAWLLSTEGAPQQIARHQYLVNDVGGDAEDSLRSNFNPDVSYAIWLPDDYIVINCNADSIYLLNLKNNDVQILFHPGDELLKVSKNKNGLLAIYMRGGYKSYIIRPREAA